MEPIMWTYIHMVQSIHHTANKSILQTQVPVPMHADPTYTYTLSPGDTHGGWARDKVDHAIDDLSEINFKLTI